MRFALLVSAIAVIAIGGDKPVAAQPRPTPGRQPVFADPDAEAELRSALWDSALTPNEASVEKALERANRSLISRDAQDAIAITTQALAASPKAISLLLLRGAAYAAQRNWSQCSADYSNALSPLTLPVADKPITNREPRSAAAKPVDMRNRIDAIANPTMQWAICTANLGELSRAEEILLYTLGAAQVKNPNIAPQEVWLRLGEVQLQQGRIRDAIATLGEINGYQSIGSMALWLQALAYDREHNVKQLQVKATQALMGDVSLANLRAAPAPMFAGTDVLLFGLAWQTKWVQDPAQIAAREKAIAYFRTFVTSQPTSAFATQVKRHLADLQANADTKIAVFGLPPSAAAGATKAKATNQPASLVRASVITALPSMRTCVSAVPTVVFTVRRVVPTIRSATGPSVGIMASAQTIVTPGPFIEPLSSDAETQFRALEAKTCIERLASALVMPNVTSQYNFTIEFALIAAQDKASAVPSAP
jgi:hypothetical protein